MTADLTREKIERLRVDFDRGHDLGYGDQRALLAHALAEPARLAAARAEGVREGIERCAVEARRYAEFYPPHSDGRNTFVMLAERFDEWHGALAPAPAEASAPVAEGGAGLEQRVDAQHAVGFREGFVTAKERYAGRDPKVAGLEAEVAALKMQIAEADRALEPFASVGCWLFARPLPDDMPVLTLGNMQGPDGALTRGQFKAAHRARALLQGRNGAVVEDKAAALEAENENLRATVAAEGSDAAAARKRVRELNDEVAALRKRSALVVQALDGPGANAQLLVSAVDGLRALLHGQGGAS